MLRLAHPDDAQQIADIYAPVVLNSSISFEIEPPTVAETRRRLDDSLTWLVCQKDQEILGYVYASQHRQRPADLWSVDVAVDIRESARRRGVARALYLSLFAILRLQGYRAAHAGVTLPNPGSVGLHESLGFLPVGIYRKVGFKMGQWHDVGWWQLELAERNGQPTAPLSLARAQELPGWSQALETGNSALRL